MLAVLAAGVAGCFNSNQPGAKEVSGKGSGVLRLQGIEWGRLVDVTDLADLLVSSDVLIRPDLAIDEINYSLSINPVTESEVLKIHQPVNSAAFNALLSAARGGLVGGERKGPNDPPPYTQIARNAALRLRFSELVDPATVNSITIQLLWGDPPSLPLTVRYVVQNDEKSGSGYVLLDPTISTRQSAQLGLPVNASGFPESFDSINDNLLVRIPTEVELLFGQPQVLRNKSNTRNITAAPGEPQEASIGGNPVVVRSLRTGNANDAFSGFLQDLTPPHLIGVQDITVSEVGDMGGAVRDLTYSVNASYCRNLTPKVGDVFEFSSGILMVSAVLNSGNPAAYQVRAALLEGALNAGTGLVLSGRLSSKYTLQDANRQICYLSFSPLPVSTPGQPLKLDRFSSVSVRFSEPIDAASVTSMNSFVVSAFEMDGTYGNEVAYYRHPTLAPNEGVANYVDRLRGYHLALNSGGTASTSEFGGRILFGPIEPSPNARVFTLTPLAGFAEPNPNATPASTFLQFAVALRDGPSGVHDLAGNPVSFTGFVAGTPIAGVPVESQLTVPNASGGLPGGGTNAALKDKYFCLRGLAIDENADGMPEYAGQFDVLPGKVLGRPVGLFSRQADSSNFYIGAQNPVPFGTTLPPVEPLTPAGAVVMTCYRPQDLGFGFLNPLEYDLDVVGMSWTPQGGVVFDDTFPRFSLALAHSKFMPDESRTITGGSAFPASGLNFTETFDSNILGFDEGFDEEVVFDGSFQLRSINLYNTVSGVTMLSWPEFSQLYTWRDTSFPSDLFGGGPPFPASVGSPPATYTGVDAPPGFWPPEQVPSIALPLLARFRCYPRGAFLGSNQFQVSQMVPNSPLPAFRVFSAGGRDANGIWHQVLPDNAAQGGASPVGGYSANGSVTPNRDNVVYWAEVDFVTRISRVFTHWFDMSSPLQLGAARGTVLEPENANQASGTSVVVEYRGAVQVNHSGNPLTNPSPLTDASAFFDNYGEYTASGVSTPSPWTTDLGDLEGQGYRYFQVRLSFVSNADQSLQAVMDGLGLAWATQ